MVIKKMAIVIRITVIVIILFLSLQLKLKLKKGALTITTVVIVNYSTWFRKIMITVILILKKDGYGFSNLGRTYSG